MAGRLFTFLFKIITSSNNRLSIKILNNYKKICTENIFCHTYVTYVNILYLITYRRIVYMNDEVLVSIIVERTSQWFLLREGFYRGICGGFSSAIKS